MPAETDLQMVDISGREDYDDTVYPEFHEYIGQSTIWFGVAPTRAVVQCRMTQARLCCRPIWR